VLLSEFIRRGSSELEKLYPWPEARGMILILCEDLLGVRRHTHILDPGFQIPQEKTELMKDGLRRLLEGEPVQYVTGKAQFCGRIFNVNPSVLIPRPETEYIVEFALEACREKGGKARVLDLCTGSGCIAWSVALGNPDAEIVATDISGQALETAGNQFPTPGPKFILSDVLDTDQDWEEGMFDVLTSNPPYIMEKQKADMRANVLQHEPSLALFVPDSDPLVFYRAIASLAARLLKEGGKGIVEINDELGAESRDLFAGAGFRNCSIIKDFCGRDRFISFCK